MSDRPIYVCHRTRAPITIDGRLDEGRCGARLARSTVRTDGVGRPAPTDLRLCWDGDFLYLGAVATDTDI
jgi:hypothetical protein